MFRSSSGLQRSNVSVNEKSGLPDSIANLYYKHGLFLSSYPTCASSIAIVALLFCCYPLVNIPLPGTIPTKVVLPFEGRYSLLSEREKNFSIVKNIFNMNNLSYETPFPWAQSNPIVYIQQILLRSSVIPWSNDMQLMDAFRSPLYEVFKLIEIIRNHESEERITLDHICLHVENVKRGQNNPIFPEYNCLVLSPANLWSQNVQNFTRDVNILNSVFQYHNLQKTKVSVAEMLFGLPIPDSGFKRYPLRSRSRVIQYAITLILKTNNKEYLKSLKEKLVNIYPMHQTQIVPEFKLNGEEKEEVFKKSYSSKSYIMYIYYPGEFKFFEFLPICTAFLLSFTYIYFSIRKINVIRSRLILALCSVFTVLGSLMMSLGLCFFFGLTISLQSKEIFPYLVILVGLENCLVITKSVVSTDETFDIKIRVAQALSKEGWHITKTLLTEITILTIGLSTFVPVIQEFCVFAIVGLLSDFMLQMLFFSTILAMNIKRIEYTMEAKNLPKMMMNYGVGDSKRIDFKFFANSSSSIGDSQTSFHRSHSHPKLTMLKDKFNLQDSVGSNKRSTISLANDEQKQRIPKRLKLVNFWARTRFFQRAFMIWMSVWIFSIIYNSGFLESFFIIDVNNTNSRYTHTHRNVKINDFLSNVELPKKFSGNNFKNKAENNTMEKDFTYNMTEQLEKLRFPDFDLNYFLSNFHWSAIMKQYNISLSGRYVTILPTIKLSHAIKPEEAILLRNSKEKLTQNFQWKSLAAALDPLDFSDDENRVSPLITSGSGGTPLYPKSPMEICLAIMLCAISIFVLCYTMVVFYRCICTRNYAEWRSSWNESEFLRQNTEQILEGVPVQISGHSNRIECLVSDGTNIISSCLKGQIKVWDTKSGELLTEIDRSIFPLGKTQNNTGHFILKDINPSPIWCLDYIDNLIAVGCANGRMEFWETPTGSLKCTYHEDLKRGQGITHIHLNGDRVIVARLNGMINFYRLETYYKGKQIDWGFTSAYRRTHVRAGSAGSISLMNKEPSDIYKGAREEMKCTLDGVRCAHQQPITCMEVVNGTVLTGSQDHTLKVYCMENPGIEYTLHGHCGPITCLFVDRWQPGTGGSGSQDGFLCVWDLFTGACMYNIQAHDGSISSLACAPSYVISLGTDERICVWERFQGNLLSAINISNAYSNLLMLTPSLLITTKLGSLIVWDVRTGEPAREVKLDCSNSQLCPKIIILAGNSVVCDYGNSIRVVRFPLVADKCN